jgi:hypothetical protein
MQKEIGWCYQACAVKDDYREAMARALGVLASTLELLTPPQPTVDDEAAMGVTLIQFQVTVAALSNDSIDPGSASSGTLR